MCFSQSPRRKVSPVQPALSLPGGQFIAQLVCALPPRSPEMEVMAAVNAGLRDAA